MKFRTWVACAIPLLATVWAHATLIGVNLEGRSAAQTTNAYPLAASATAGVFAQQNFNNVEFGTSGTTGALNDSTGTATSVTLNVAANDSWNSDGGTTSANELLTKGIIKANGTNATSTFTFNNVPDGKYNLVAYTLENGAGALGNFTAGGVTYYTTESNNFTSDGGFIRAINTDPAGTRDVGNYVQFDNITSSGGSLVFTETHISGTDGVGIAGFQLQSVVPEPATLGLLGMGAIGLLLRRRAR